jgi:hypothetical protein
VTQVTGPVSAAGTTSEATTAPFFFDPAALAALAVSRRDFATAEPFPHIVFDGLVPDDVLRRVVEEFPGAQGREWEVKAAVTSAAKLTAKDDWTMGPTTRQVLDQLNSAAVLNWLEEVTGIEGLVPDPHFVGGGMHQTVRGGFLKVHADFNWHKRLRLDRRLNLVLYLNEGWREEWGGDLELWDREMTHCVRRIAPELGRCVVFVTNDDCFHGHPEPLACPEGVARRSLALYYYTNGRPAQEKSRPHSSIYRTRPGERLAYRGKAWLRYALDQLRGGEEIPTIRSAPPRKR